MLFCSFDRIMFNLISCFIYPFVSVETTYLQWYFIDIAHLLQNAY
jgi:hypothetical protein